MPPKEKPKKIENKELELQKQAEDAKRKEEEEKRKLEEQRKYEVVTLPTGLKMILTEYCIVEAWKNPKPRDFFVDFITRYLKKESLLDNFESVELNILGEFHLHNLIFAKEELCLDDRRAAIFLNLMWTLLTERNPNYSKKNLNESPKGSKKSLILDEKNLHFDCQNFMKLLEKHTLQTKSFDKCQIIKILEYVNNGFFKYYKLYKNLFDNKKKNEEVFINVIVDEPMKVLPLKEALYMGKTKIEVKDEEQEYNNEIKARILKIEEEKRLQELEELKMKEQEILNQNEDHQTKMIIEDNIGKIRNKIIRTLKTRENELESQIDGILKNKKK